jgi:hypothetical protein
VQPQSIPLRVKILVYLHAESRDCAVGKATGYGLGDQGVGVLVPVRSKIFSSPRRPDRLWGPPNLLSNAYRGSFPRRQSGRGVNLTTHLQLVPRSRKYLSIHHSPILLHGVVLNNLSTGTILPYLFTCVCVVRITNKF